jgi:hypothetical protein
MHAVAMVMMFFLVATSSLAPFAGPASESKDQIIAKQK